MIGRRKYLSGVWAAVFGGCSGIGERCGDSDTPGAGAKAPWAEVDSPADIVVSNARSTAVTATLTGHGNERTFTLGPTDDWVSDDILAEGEDATLTVTTPDGLAATIEWVPEDESTNRFCVFNIAPDRIRTGTSVKEADTPSATRSRRCASRA